MKLHNRITELEALFAIDTVPLTMAEYTKYFLMFTEEMSSGYATDYLKYSEQEWKWYRENEDNHRKTGEALERWI